jgi:glycosyltransferase involved in cell wall biosynthesis
MVDNEKISISVVTPVYGCKTCLYELYFRLKETIEKIAFDFEIIMVNDASPDGAWESIVDLANKDKRVKGINLSRNFGQHYAISAGLDYCQGEWIVVMDCDLQDQPEEIAKLYNEAIKGYHIVYALRNQRKDKLLKRVFSKMFNAILGYLTNTVQDSTIANFGIYHRKVIDSIRNMGDYHRYFPTMVRWVGFRHTKIGVTHAERVDGHTSYSLKMLTRLSIDIILSFSDKPLRLAVKFGFIISFLTLIFAIYNLILFFNNKILVPGYTSLIISVWFLSGLIIMVLGIVGLYIGKTFDKVKGRPSYLIMGKTF